MRQQTYGNGWFEPRLKINYKTEESMRNQSTIGMIEKIGIQKAIRKKRNMKGEH